MKRNIITIQSQVATGYVGNSMATLAIQLHGFDPVEVPTVLLSNHIEYPIVKGDVTPLALFSEILQGIKINKILSKSDYLISGFNKDEHQISFLADYIHETKQEFGYQFVYDPVFGDFRAGGLYIPKIAADTSIECLLPLADYLLPNHFELEYILKTEVKTEKEFRDALVHHPLLKSKTIISTGTQLGTVHQDHLSILLYHDGQTQKFETPHLKIEALGTGDLFTAVFTSQLNKGKTLENAITTSIHFLHETLTYCIEKGLKEYNAEVLVKNINLLS